MDFNLRCAIASSVFTELPQRVLRKAATFRGVNLRIQLFSSSASSSETSKEVNSLVFDNWGCNSIEVMKVVSFMLRPICVTLFIKGLGSCEVPKIDSPASPCGGRSKKKGFLHLNRVKTLEMVLQPTQTNRYQQEPSCCCLSSVDTVTTQHLLWPMKTHTHFLIWNPLLYDNILMAERGLVFGASLYS